jgi:Protein of unknown function (DUF732)
MFAQFTKFAGGAVIAAGLGLAAFAGAGTAAAATADDVFLADIRAEGIAYDSPRVAIENAQTVCSLLDTGADPVDVGNELLANTDLTTRQAAAFVVLSVGTYCPEYEGQLA